jgi:hypothetical protein
MELPSTLKLPIISNELNRNEGKRSRKLNELPEKKDEWFTSTHDLRPDLRRFTNRPISDGNVPVKVLSCKRRSCTLASSPSSTGNVPANALSFSCTTAVPSRHWNTMHQESVSPRKQHRGVHNISCLKRCLKRLTQSKQQPNL